MDVGPKNGETGARKPPKEISSVVAPSEKELFMIKVYLFTKRNLSTHSSITVNTNHQRETTLKQILITISQKYYFSNIKTILV